jgi:hypothetical protein
MTMDQTYTRKQAMERLGVRSTHAFTHMVKKYPDAFVVVKNDLYKFRVYDKEALDNFAKIRETIKRISTS